MINHAAWEIIPRKSIGPISLGMSSKDCVSLLGDTYDEFRKTPGAKWVTLAFNSEFVHVTLDAKSSVTGISVFRPRRIELNGVQLLDRETLSVSFDLQRLGFKTKQIDTGIWCKEAGLVLVDIDGQVDGVELELV